MELITGRINNLMQWSEPDYGRSKPQALEPQSQESQSSAYGQQQLQPDVVNISIAGQNKLDRDDDKISLFEGLHKLSTNQQDEFTTEPASVEQGAIDAAIKALQQQIKEIEQQMEPLKGKEDEAAQEQLEQLEAQLMTLNFQLMELNNQKLEKINKISNTP